MNGVNALGVDASRCEPAETVNMPIEIVLQLDPARCYSHCDALTRIAYHRALAQISSCAGVADLEVARAAIARARLAANESAEQHVGHYLIGPGRRELERIVGARVPPKVRLNRFVQRHCSAAYFSIVVSVGATLMFVLYRAMASQVSVPVAVTGLTLLFIPILRAAAAISQVSLHPWFPPERLPRLHLPPNSLLAAKAAIVLPVIICAENDLNEAIDTLERNYLQLEHRGILLFLLTDLRDASQQDLPEDRYLLDIINRRIELLNARHGSEGSKNFHHLYRKRVFNQLDQCWMGWERKRGKLVEFCRLIAGGSPGSFVGVERMDVDLSKLEYVITLDADSVLERRGAAALIGTLAHPLNSPTWRGDVVQSGYGVVRPRLVPATATSSGLFFKVMYGDPRRAPVRRELQPSFYQDVVGADMFFGKGIFHVRTFAACVDGKIPQNLVLSHDHLEGIFARVGFSSDILLFEDFPADALTWRLRQHRWIRGDTQAAVWMLPWVPSGARGWVRSRLSAFDRWKLAKNMIGHTSAPVLLVTAVAAWLGFFGRNGGPIGWASLFAIAAWPLILCVATLIKPTLPVPLDGSDPSVSRSAQAGRILKQGALNWLWIIVLLPDTSLIVSDAIGRSLFRMMVSKRHLLQWNTAASVQRAGLSRSALQAWLEMKGAPVAALGIAAAVWLLQPENLVWASPFVVCWFVAPQIAFLVNSKPRKESA